MPCLCRWFLESTALVYPEPDDIEMRFVQNLKLPSGPTVDYEALFELARTNLKNSWGMLGTALAAGDGRVFTLANADLGTGLDQQGVSVFWA